MMSRLAGIATRTEGGFFELVPVVMLAGHRWCFGPWLVVLVVAWLALAAGDDRQCFLGIIGRNSNQFCYRARSQVDPRRAPCHAPRHAPRQTPHSGRRQAAGIRWRIELRDDRQRGCRPAW